MRNAIICLLLLVSIHATAQSPLTQYTITAKKSETCETFLSLPLFDQKFGKDSLNQTIINELIKYHYGLYNPGLLFFRFYQQTKFDHTAPLFVNIGAMCTFNHKGIYSFVSCPINACVTDVYSNYESIALTIDSASGKPLKISDIIKKELLDSFERFVLMVATRYNIKNLPTGYFVSTNPIEIRSANTIQNPSNVLTLEMGVQPQFYVRSGQLYVYNYASNTDYPYKAVEVALPLSLVQFFMKPTYAAVFSEGY